MIIEADMWKALIEILEIGLAANGVTDIEVAQAYQPTKQGGSERAVYLHKIMAPRVGHQGREYRYNIANDNFDTIEKYWQSVHIQALTHVEQDTNDVNSLTNLDIAGLCAAILQTRNTRSQLLKAGISIENIKDIVIIPHQDDRGEFDTSPSFDFILLYPQELVSVEPKADPIEPDIRRVN
jgi:hypothetical protein